MAFHAIEGVEALSGEYDEAPGDPDQMFKALKGFGNGTR